MSQKLTIEIIKQKLSKINPDILITSSYYENNKTSLNCKCLKCQHEWESNWSSLNTGRGCSNCKTKKSRLSPQEVIDYVTSQNYQFVNFTSGDKASNYRLDIICPNEHEYNVKYKDFKAGKRCKSCFEESGISGVRKAQDDIVNSLKEMGYTVSNEFKYMNRNEKFYSKCSLGHVRYDSYSVILNQPKCPTCAWGRNSKRYSENDVKRLLADIGLRYIEGFENIHSKITFKCKCGKESVSSFNRLMKSGQCRECSNKKLYTIEELQMIFSLEGCALLETENTKVSRLKYLCKCGNESVVSLYDFRNGVRCSSCFHTRNSGENHPCWNPNLTDAEREKNRKTPEYTQWRISVYKRDNYTCQCCGDNTGGNLEAHHLDSHNWAKDKRLDIDNGVTLCNLCHTDFHNLYGYGDNTKEQFEEYVLELYSYI